MVDVGNVKNFTVTWFDQSDAYVTTADITNDVIGIPQFTDKGSGSVNTAQLTLSADFGDFVTDNGTPAVIDQYDRFRIKMDDLAGNTYDHFFEFKPPEVPSQTKAEGTQVTFELLGIEYAVQNIHFNRAFWFEDAFVPAREIGVVYLTLIFLMLKNLDLQRFKKLRRCYLINNYQKMLHLQ